MSNRQILDQVAALQPLFERFAAEPNLEIEAKLGRLLQNGSRRFNSGVSKEEFTRIHDMLNSYTKWDPATTTPDWVPTFDYFLDGDLRCTKSANGHKFIKKTTLQHLDLRCAERHYDIRVSLKEELPMDPIQPGIPSLVRVKKRKSFGYKYWCFDLTIVWSGCDEQDAQNNEPTFEVELECINRKEAAANPAYCAASMLEKMVDFLGRDTPYTLTLVR